MSFDVFGRPTRRQILQQLASLGVVSSTAGLLGMGATRAALAADAESVNLTLAVWPAPKSVAPRAVLERFVASHEGVTGEAVEGSQVQSFQKIQASLAVNPDEPWAQLGMFNAQRFADGAVADMWHALDPEKIPNLQHLVEGLQPADRRGAFWIADLCGIMYNKRLVSTPPTSWYDLFDPIHKGKVTVWQAPAFSVNGVALFTRLEGGDESNMEPGISLFEKAAAAGQFTGFHGSADQLRKMFQTDQAAIGIGFQGIVQPWIDDGDEIGFVIPKGGTFVFPEGWQMVKGLKGRTYDLACELLNEMLSPETVTEYSLLNPTIPLVRGARVPEKYASIPTFSLDGLDEPIVFDWTKMAGSLEKTTELWNDRVATKL